MSKEKYYTPSIEEFRVGFECEILNGYGEWFKIIFDKCHLYNDLKFTDKFDNLENAFRVKFLDKEDIESLGFTNKDRNSSPSNFFKFIKEGHKTKVFEIAPYWDYGLSKTDTLIRIYVGYLNEYPYREIFRGDVKNKSELKKILTQLRINE